MALGLFLLSLLSAFSFALGIVLSSYGLRHLSPLAGGAISVPTSAVLLLAVSPLTVNWAGWQAQSALIFAICGAFYPAGVTLLNFFSNRSLGPNLTAALGNVTPLFAVLLAVILLGEVPDFAQLGGLAVILAGLFLLATDRARSHPGVTLWLLALPLLAAAIRGAIQPVVKTGLAGWPDAFAATTITYVMSAAVILCARAAVPQGPTTYTPRAIAIFAAIGISNGMAVLTLYAALARGPVTLVAPVVATYPLMTYAMNRLALRKRGVTPRGVAGIVLTVLGVMALLAL